MAVDAKQYISELAQKAGLDASVTDSILKAAENPNFAKELANGVMRQDEFSRSMDTLKTQEAALLENQGKWTKFHQDNVNYVKELEGKVGVASPRGDGDMTGISQAELDKRMKEQYDRTVGVNVNITKQALTVMDDYRSRFGKPLDLDALEKFALEKNLNIKSAYDEMIKPELEVKQKEQREAELKTAREEGAKEALSKHNLPLDNAPADQAPFFQPKSDAQPLTEGQRARGFAETWQQNAGQ